MSDVLVNIKTAIYSEDVLLSLISELILITQPFIEFVFNTISRYLRVNSIVTGNSVVDTVGQKLDWQE